MRYLKKIILITILQIFYICYSGCSKEHKQKYDRSYWIDTQKKYWERLLNKNERWYSSDQSIKIANNILIYQHPSGGWPKNIDYKITPSRFDIMILKLSKIFKKYPSVYQPTIDNQSSYSQMRFLEKVFIHTGDERFRSGFLYGFDYLISAQNDNGGWPQYFPLQGGYKNNITFNDNAINGVMQILKDISDLKFIFVDSLRINKSTKAIEKGLELILKTQIKSNGELTAWCAQYNTLNLHPSSARPFEPISLSARESVRIVQYLMTLNNPDIRIIRAIEGAIEWYKNVGIKGLKIIEVENDDASRGFDIKISIDSKNKLRPLNWARFYEINTNFPIFSDRDGIIKYAMSELNYERRINYEWYGTWANDLIFKHYPIWIKRYKKK